MFRQAFSPSPLGCGTVGLVLLQIIEFCLQRIGLRSSATKLRVDGGCIMDLIMNNEL